MALAAALSALAAALSVRFRARLLAPVEGDRAFAAAFAGGLLAGLVGALVEDSGPLLLVEAVFTLACVACYLHARPAPEAGLAPAPRGASQPRSAATELAAMPNATIAVLGGSEGTA